MTSILSGNRLPALISDDDSDSSTDIDDEDIGPSRVTNDLPPLVTDSDSSDSNEDIFNHGDQSDGEQFSEPESLPDLESDSSDDSDGHIDDELFRSRDDSSGMSDDGVHFSDDEFDMSREELGVVQMLDQHLDVLQAAPSFIAISLRMLYERVLGAMEPEEDKDSPTRPDIILKLPMVKIDAAQVDSKESCCICFLDYDLDENVMKLPCEHLYHKDCILNWFKIRSTCPKCRLDLNVTFPSNHSTNTTRESEAGLADETVASVTSRLMRALVNNVGRYDVTDFDEDVNMTEPTTEWYSEADFLDPDSSSATVERDLPRQNETATERETSNENDRRVPDSVGNDLQTESNLGATSVSRLRRLFEPSVPDSNQSTDTSSRETTGRTSSVSRLRRLFDQSPREPRRRLLDMSEIREGPSSQSGMSMDTERSGIATVSNENMADTKNLEGHAIAGMEVEVDTSQNNVTSEERLETEIW